MPHAIVIETVTENPVYLSRVPGNHLQAAFLNLIREVDTMLSSELHDGNVLRTYALGWVPQGRMQSTYEDYDLKSYNPMLRIACIDDRIYPVLMQWALNANGKRLSLHVGGENCIVKRITVTNDGKNSWAGYLNLDELAARASNTETKITFQFASPVAFGQGKREEFLPQPSFVFGSLMQRCLAAFSDKWTYTNLKEDFLNMIHEHIVIVQPYELRSAIVNLGENIKQTGSIGRATYRIINKPDPSFIHFINMFSDAAFFTGVGKRTSRGCGMIRRIYAR